MCSWSVYSTSCEQVVGCSIFLQPSLIVSLFPTSVSHPALLVQNAPVSKNTRTEIAPWDVLWISWESSNDVIDSFNTNFAVLLIGPPLCYTKNFATCQNGGCVYSKVMNGSTCDLPTGCTTNASCQNGVCMVSHYHNCCCDEAHV